jgi:hypothetical protein
MIFKTILGLGAVAAYYFMCRRHEIKNRAISGSSFIWANIVFFSTTSLIQLYYDMKSGHFKRLDLHKKAFYLRFAELWQFFKNNKKPFVH